MAPAHQRLDADDLRAAHVALRLVQQIQLVVAQRLAQADFELHVAHDLHRQRRAVQLGVVLAAVLGVVHRGVGVLEQRAAIVAVLREQRDADAGGDEDLVALDEERPAHRFLDPVRHVERMLDPLQVGDQDRELVATQARQVGAVVSPRISARHQVARAGGVAQAVGHHLEQGVARIVAERIVDALEGVQVHEQHRELLVADLGALQLALQRLQEGLAVGDAGQAVAIGQAADLLFGALALADVAHQSQHLRGTGRHQARLEVLDFAAVGDLVLDRAHLPGGQHGFHLLQHAVGDVGGQHVADVLPDHAAVRASSLRDAPAPVAFLSRTRMSGFVIEVEAVRVHAEEGIRNGRQHSAVVGVGDAQARDGVAGAQHIQDAVAQDRPVDRLGDEVGGAGLVGVGHGLDVVAAGDHHDRHAGAVAAFGTFGRADGGAGREAVHARHVDVHQDQVRVARGRQFDRLEAVRRFDGVEPDLGQHLEHQETHHRIVVGDQDRPALGGRRGWHARFPFLGGH